MKYIFVDPGAGGASPSNATPDTSTSKYHTSASWPANGTAIWKSWNAAMIDTTIEALTDDVTFYFRRTNGAGDDTTHVDSTGCQWASVLFEGDFEDTKPSATAYKLRVTTNVTRAILCQADISHVFRKLQIESDSPGTSQGCITFQAANSTHEIDRCLLSFSSGAAAVASTARGLLVTSGAAQVLNIKNSVIKDIQSTGSSGSAIRDGVACTINVYNSIIHNSEIGVAAITAGATINLYNTALAGCTDDFSVTSGVINRTNCAYEDADSGANCITGVSDWTVVFNDYAADDFALKASDTTLKDAGTDLSGSGVTTDVRGQIRPVGAAYDIGIYEYVAGTQSIGGSLTARATSPIAGLNDANTKFVRFVSPLTGPGYVQTDPPLATGDFGEYSAKIDGTYPLTLNPNGSWEYTGFPPDGRYYFDLRVYDPEQGPYGRQYVVVTSPVVITSVVGANTGGTQRRFYSGELVTITGTGFGASQGDSRVYVGSAVQSVDSWSDTSITFTASVSNAGIYNIYVVRR